MSFSVLLSVYKNEPPQYLDEALYSIWDQQTRKPGQIVLVKDGPVTEELDAYILVWKKKIDKVLTVVELSENVGLGVALNSGLQKCSYELVARMDTDDISLSNRFEKQVAFMEANPDIVASSAVLEEWDDDFSRCINTRKLPMKHEEIIKFAKYRNPLSHPVVIFRRSVILSVGGYPALRKNQDYALWSLLLTKEYKIVNLPDVLLKQRAGNKLLNRRGVRNVGLLLEVIKFQRNIKFLNTYEYMRNIITRYFMIISPNFIKRILYRCFRK